MYCSACGKKCPDGARFCAWCGEKLPEMTPEPVANGVPEAAEAAYTERGEMEPVSPLQPAIAPALPVSMLADEPEADDPETDDPEPGDPEPDDPEPDDPEADEPETDEPETDEPEMDDAEPDLAEPEDPKPVPSRRTAANPVHSIFQRPETLFTKADDAQTVRPISANPAQPPRGKQAEEAAKLASAIATFEAEGPEEDETPVRRGERKGRPSARYDDDEWVRPARPQADRGGFEDERPAKARFDRGGDPVRDEWEDGRPAKGIFGRSGAKPTRDEWDDEEDERPAKGLFGRGGAKPARDQWDDEEDERPAKGLFGRGGKLAREEWEDERSAKNRFDRGGGRPARGESEDERPAKNRFDRDGGRPARGEWEDERSAKSAREKAADRLRPSRGAHGKAVTASGGMVTPPARRAPARPSGPFRPPVKRKGKGDLFFEDLETPTENFYDDAAEERALSRRIKSIVALALLIGVAVIAIWLAWMPGGQVFRARWNLGAPAAAYKTLGDQDRADGQIQRAADAYYSALKLDPKNYEYAMLVGQTQEMVGNRDSAAKAYMLCVSLKPAAVEPYKLLVDLYKVMGDQQAAENWRSEGYKQTGDASLAPGS